MSPIQSKLHSQVFGLKTGSQLWVVSYLRRFLIVCLAQYMFNREYKWWDGSCDAPFGESCHHFTQQVWKSTLSACFAYAKNADGWEYVVARYKSKGNISNQYSCMIPSCSGETGPCDKSQYCDGDFHSCFIKPCADTNSWCDPQNSQLTDAEIASASFI